ncbi:MAG TPA: pyruvate, phosphate dikinase [Aggregicoccus sp.]|nr:pyruvate, phosphate dikinase [Aggregicoccus sp.]
MTARSRRGAAPRKVTRGKSRSPRRPYVYSFGELKAAERAAGSWEGVRGLLGGKGANLAQMAALGLPIPPGFTITTVACNAFLAGDDFPSGMWEQVLRALRSLERESGQRFGDPARPLLLSCRSGAKFSMPGMMDTVLNLGLNDEVVEGLARLSGDTRFAYDSYRRLVQMFGTVVLGLPHEPFERVLAGWRERRGLTNDAELRPGDLQEVTQAFKQLVREGSGADFPADPIAQLRAATMAVFRSWRGKRAQDYRRAAHIPDDLGTAVNIVTMVFGNLGQDSGTGVATTRNVTDGTPQMEGDLLINAQGEDVVSGTRSTLPLQELARLMPAVDKQLRVYSAKLERHFRDVQDVEFTIERGKLWMLQTRAAKRTAAAAIRIAVDLARERRITRKEALQRVSAEHVDYFLHPQFALAARKEAKARGDHIATGLNVSPGAALGQLAFDADIAERWAKQEQRQVIMVRAETKPDDVHGMLAAAGVLTTRGGRTSHAALVARQFGKPAVVGAQSLQLDVEARTLRTAAGRVLREGDWVSIDGGTGEVYAGKLETVIPDVSDPSLLTLLGWADAVRTLGVWANADYPQDAQRARSFGAEGIGLCRTEHMFFQSERLPVVQQLILSHDPEEQARCLARLLQVQREDFAGLFTAMEGLPVTIRLIDPPLHEFLPAHDTLQREVTTLETRLELGDGEAAVLRAELEEKRRLLGEVERMREHNPMLGLRGVRLGIHMPELVRMQVRAIFEAACACVREGIQVLPKVMIPLSMDAAELRFERTVLEEEASKVMEEQGRKIPYEFGTMIEVPRAALVAERLAEHAEFFSFGTNDLTQTTYGISRDDAETGFLAEYLQKGIFTENPFAILDEAGVGKLMRLAVESVRGGGKRLELGICGEHGGEPRSIAFCHQLGLDYVSCSPYRVPIARLAAAHAALAQAPASAGRGRG